MQRIKFLAVLLLLFGPAASAQIGLPYNPIIQTNNGSTGGATVTCAFDRGVTSGNILMMGFTWFGPNNTPSLSDTVSSTYHQMQLDWWNTNTLGAAIYAATAAGSGANTISATTTSGSFQNAVCAELAPGWDTTTVDATATPLHSSSGTSVTTNNVTPNKNGDLLFAFTSGFHSGSRAYIDPSSSWPAWTELGYSNGQDNCEFAFQVGGAAGTAYNMTFQALDTPSQQLAIALKPSALTITTDATLPDAAVSAPYSYQMQAIGGASSITWSLTSGSFQVGLSMNSSGLVSGTPTFGPTKTVTVQATDGTSTTTKSITLKVSSSMNSIAFVQGKQTGSGVSALSYTSNVTSGNLLVAHGGQPLTHSEWFYCTDTLGTVFRTLTVQSFANSVNGKKGWGSKVVAGFAPSSGADTVTCSSGAGVHRLNGIAEFSGLVYVSNETVLYTSGTTTSGTVTSGTITTLEANEVILGVCQGSDGTSAFAASSPFNNWDATAMEGEGIYRIVTTATGYTASCTQATNTGGWLFSLSALRPSGGAAAPPPPAGRHQLISN